MRTEARTGLLLARAVAQYESERSALGPAVQPPAVRGRCGQQPPPLSWPCAQRVITCARPGGAQGSREDVTHTVGGGCTSWPAALFCWAFLMSLHLSGA